MKLDLLVDKEMLKNFILILSASLIGSLVGFGQGEIVEKAEIRVEVEAVNLIVAVTNKLGRAVTTLNKNNFRILENGKSQTITNFGIESNLPLNIALLIDTSASVKTKLEFEKKAATNFVFAIMHPRDRAMLAEFDTAVTLVSDFTRNPTQIASQLKGLQAGGGTALLDAIFVVAKDKLNFPAQRNIAVIISDGLDLDSNYSTREVLQQLQKNNILVYGIGTNRIGTSENPRGERILNKLSNDTGGRCFFPYSAEQLHYAFNLIEEEVRSLYSLTYVPNKKERDGNFRKIKVKLVKAKNLIVRHRKGYYAPS